MMNICKTHANFQGELDQADCDRSSCASDLGDVESVPSVNTDTDDMEYINPRGVRFTPGQYEKEGQLCTSRVLFYVRDDKKKHSLLIKVS